MAGKSAGAPKGTRGAGIRSGGAACPEKGPLTKELLTRMDAWWRAANYLSAGQLYLLENPLLKKPLKREMVKKKIVGHWGTVPGQNFDQKV